MILCSALILLLAGLFFYVKKLREQKKQERLASQLRQSLQNMVHALRSGTGLLQALDYATQEGGEPLASEWRRLLQSVRIGHSLAEALDQLVLRVSIKEIKWFVAAVQITQNTGGSLAEVLDTLSTTLQEQQSLRERVSALTAQGKASGALLSLLPFAMTGALYLIMPEMIRPMFTTSLGQLMLAGVMVSVGIGTLVIQKIVSVKVD